MGETQGHRGSRGAGQPGVKAPEKGLQEDEGSERSPGQDETPASSHQPFARSFVRQAFVWGRQSTGWLR